MPNLNLQNVPEPVIERLRETAAKTGRSIDEQAVEALRIGVVEITPRTRAWVDGRLAAARTLRQSLRTWITEEAIRAARNEGRA